MLHTCITKESAYHFTCILCLAGLLYLLPSVNTEYAKFNCRKATDFIETWNLIHFIIESGETTSRYGSIY